MCAFGDLDLDGANDLALLVNGGIEVVSGQSGQRLAWQPGLGSWNMIWLGADRNGDGLADGIVLGENSGRLISEGYNWDVISRATGSGAVQSPGMIYPPESRIPFERLGGEDWPSKMTGFEFVADAADLDGDGCEDILVQNPGKKQLGLFAVSWKHIDRAMFRLPPTRRGGSRHNDFAVETGMQLDGGTAPDLVVCDQRAIFSIRLHARSGESGKLLWELDLVDLGGPTFVSMARVSDQDGDGRDDLMLGMYDPALHGPLWEGRLHVLSGATGKVLWQMEEWDLER